MNNAATQPAITLQWIMQTPERQKQFAAMIAEAVERRHLSLGGHGGTDATQHTGKASRRSWWRLGIGHGSLWGIGGLSQVLCNHSNTLRPITRFERRK